MYRCDTCVCAADIYGRCCRHGLLYPVMLLTAGRKECPYYEPDAGKIRETMAGGQHLRNQDNKEDTL